MEKTRQDQDTKSNEKSKITVGVFVKEILGEKQVVVRNCPLEKLREVRKEVNQEIDVDAVKEIYPSGEKVTEIEVV